MSMQPSVWGSRAPDDGLRGGGVTTTQVPPRPDWLWDYSEWIVNTSSTPPPIPQPKPDYTGGGGDQVRVPVPGRRPDLDTLTGASSSRGSQTLTLPVRAGAILAVLGAVALVSR